MTKTIAGLIMAGITFALNWYLQATSPIHDGNNISSARPPSSEYSDANYPQVPTYDETGAIFFNSAATGANDGTSWADGYTDELTALNALCASPAGTMLTCRGTFNLGNGIALNHLGGQGAQGSEYVFRADPVNGCDIISTNATGEGGIEYSNKTRWITYGFNITGGGRIFSYFPGGTSSGGCTYMTYRHITGAMSIGGDNVGWLHMDTGAADYIGAFNCAVVGAGQTGFSTNTAVIFLSRVVHWRIQNCEMSNSLTGFYYKHFEAATYVQGAGVFKDNYIYDCSGNGGNDWAMHIACKGCTFENNIVVGRTQFAADGGGDDGADDNVFTHNTLKGVVDLSELSGGALGNNLADNIIDGNLLILPDQGVIASTNILNYNLYSGTIRYQQRAAETLAQWQADSVPAGQDVNSLAGTPTYTGGANPTTIAGFALSGGTGVNAASDGTDMGADVTTVGAAA